MKKIKEDKKFVVKLYQTGSSNNLNSVEAILENLEIKVKGNLGVITTGIPLVNGLKIYQLPSFIALSLNIENPVFTMPIIDTDILNDVVESSIKSFDINTLIIAECSAEKWVIKVYYYESIPNASEQDSGLAYTGYTLGSNCLEKEEILSKKDISIENQMVIWPSDEGFPYIPKFESELEIKLSLKSIVEKILLTQNGKGVIFFSYNGYQAENNTFPTFRLLLNEADLEEVDIVDYEASCFGSLYALKTIQQLICDGKYDYGVYLCISDRARHFNSETRLFSINYADAIGYAVVSKDYSFKINSLESVTNTDVLKKDFPEVVGNRNSLVLKNKLSKLECQNIINISPKNGYDKENRSYILPRVSPSSKEKILQTKWFSSAENLRNDRWPTGIFSGLNWIVDIDKYERLERYEQIFVSTIGYGFTWASVVLERP